jgi:hypothetical protein
MGGRKMGLQELTETPKERSQKFQTGPRTGGNRGPALPVSGFSAATWMRHAGQLYGTAKCGFLCEEEQAGQCERTGCLIGIKGEGSRMSDKNSKGCDIGYALAASSCEGANNVDACTVTAFDAITAFAVPDPGLLLAEPAGFFGSWRAANCFAAPDHPVYFGSATVYFD